MINIVIIGWKNSLKILFKYLLILLLFILIILITIGYTASSKESSVTETKTQDEPNEAVADVLLVEVIGEKSDGYQFQVTISSPDKGCHQYTDWWEILTEEGTLIYRRILAHSHVNEQPFMRSGGPVIIAEDTIVIIRAHMNPTGYGGKAMKGSISKGFDEIEIDKAFASEVENKEPQPGDCAF